MAGISSEGITLAYKTAEGSEYINVANLQEVPDLSNGERETIEVTCLADSERKFIGGLFGGSEGLEFKVLYTKEEFLKFNELTDSADWKITFGDTLSCSFTGACSVKLDGAGVGAALTYTLTVVPTSKLTFA